MKDELPMRINGVADHRLIGGIPLSETITTYNYANYRS